MLHGDWYYSTNIGFRLYIVDENWVESVYGAVSANYFVAEFDELTKIFSLFEPMRESQKEIWRKVLPIGKNHNAIGSPNQSKHICYNCHNLDIRMALKYLCHICVISRKRQIKSKDNTS